MIVQTTEILTYGGPPLLGALIGYLTNKVAIRMLFRPLKPWYVLGQRVPMTPGIIPSKRHEFAQNIGKMVGEQLLTATDIGTALSTERFQRHLHRLLNDRITDALSKDFGPLLTLVPRQFRAHARIALRLLKRRLRTGVQSYIGSPSFAGAADKVLAELLKTAGRQELNELLRAEDRQDFYAAIDSLLARLLNDPAAADQLGVQLEKMLTEAAVSGKSLADFLPEEFREMISSTIADQAPQLLAQVAVILSEPSMRAQIVQAVKGGLDHFIDSLGPMAAMARGVIDNMENLDGIIESWLEGREEALGEWLEKPEIQERVAQALTDQTQAFFATPLANLLVKIEPEKLRRTCQRTGIRIITIFRENGVRQIVSAMIREQLEELLKHGRISLAELADMMLSAERREKITLTLSNELRRLMDSEQTSRLISRLVNSIVDKTTAQPVGILQGLIPVEVRRGMSDYLVQTVNRMLIREVPGLVDSLRIKELVTNKVDSLDLLRLERLLLSIMEEQFKYINLFGALLGFLIGLLNLVVIHLS